MNVRAVWRRVKPSNATKRTGFSREPWNSIKVGRLQGANYPVRFSSSGALRKDDKDAERLKKIEERLPREKLLSDYVLLIPKAKLEDTLKKRTELLEKKEEAKK